MSALYLRKVIHSQAIDNYRVILKNDGLEIEVGSIGIQHGSGGTEHWVWAINNVVPSVKSIRRAPAGIGRIPCDSSKVLGTSSAQTLPA
jgi:hypothetical protein